MTRTLYFGAVAGFSGFIFGVWLRSLIFLDWWAIVSIVFLALILFIVRAPRLVIIFLIFVALGTARYNWSEWGRISLDNYVGQSFTFSGVVDSLPKTGGSSQQLIIEPSGDLSQAGKILVRLPTYPIYHYGDEVKISGTLEKPENFLTDSGREFDYLTYLSKSNIHYVVSGFSARATLVAHNRGSRILTLLYSLQGRFISALGQLLPEPASSLGAGVTIGASSGLDQTTSDNFRRAGLSHIVVLSGYNITIVAGLVLSLFALLPRWLGLSAGAVSIILFTLMTGASATAVRAAIMSTLAITARGSGRLYRAGNSLIVAGGLMIMFNPKLLVFDISFQLSFLATMGLVFLSPIIEPYLCWLTTRFGLREMFATTLSAQLAVTPWLVYKMGNLSLVALPANLLILPFVPLSMMFTGLAGVFGIINISLATPIGYLAYLPLAWMIMVANWFADLPLATVNLNQIPVVLVMVSYLFLAMLVIKQYLAKRLLSAYDELGTKK